MSSGAAHTGAQHRDQEQKHFVEITPVPVVKHTDIWQLFVTNVVWEHTLETVDSSYVRLLEIYSGVTAPQIIETSWHSIKLLE